MKALGASVLLIALLSVAKPVGAVHYGTLAADQPYTLNIDNGPIGVGVTSVRVVYYLTGGKPATKFDIFLVAAGAREQSSQVIPRNTVLIAIEVDAPRGGTVNVDVVQDLKAFTETCVGDCTLTFDLQ
jgi:hypothetical protein